MPIKYTKSSIPEAGEFSYGVPTVFRFKGSKSKLRIGKFCSISSGVEIYLGGEHRTDWLTTYPLSLLFNQEDAISKYQISKGDVIIENDVWIGRGVTILSGVNILNGSCIGAMSVVTKDVPPYSIVAGNPAKVLRYRFEKEIIRKLLKARWWDWPVEKIIENSSILCSSNPQKLWENIK